MSHRRYIYYWLVILCLSLLLFQVNTRPVAACSPLPPDWWFTEVFTVDDQHLPPDISIKSSVTSDKMFGDRGYLEIANNSATPLYLLAQGQAGDRVVAELPVTLPEGMIPTHKLTADQSLLLDVKRLASMALGLQDRNRQADDRPTDGELPASQQAQLILVYGDRLITVPVTLSYVLNPNYDPKQSQNSAQACAVMALIMIPLVSLWYAVKWGFLLGLVIFVGICAWIGWRWKRSKPR